MSKLIIITEICSEGSVTGAYDYDLLPINVKSAVDKALNPTFGTLNYFSAQINIYRDGLQYLFEIKHPEVNIGSSVEYMGSVELYHDENGDFDEDEEY